MVGNAIDRVTRLRDYLGAMPKAELHVHLEGSVAPETLLILAERNGIDLPFSTAEEFIEKNRYRNFGDFADAIVTVARCLRRPAGFAFAVERLGAQMAAENIRYAEVIWVPQFYLRREFGLDGVLAGLNEGRQRALRKWGVEIRWICDLVRSVPGPAEAVQSWACGEAARAGGVVALGLGGPESEKLPPLFETLGRRARDAGLPVVPHAGEGAGPASVWAALKQLGASRIGHGVRAVEDESLIEYLAASRTPLDVSLTSNVILGIYPSYAEHPIKRLVAAGCAVTINSDDPALFGTSLSDEYFHAIQDCGLSLAELEAAALQAVAASCLAEPEKSSMLEAFRNEYRLLKREHLAPENPA